MTDGMVKRIRTVFEDTPEVASWLEQDGNSYDYDLAEARTHMLGMWETMQVAADRIEAQAAEIERLREALMDVLVYAPEHIHGMPKKYYEKIAAGHSE
jgi:phage baseplate assembly protein gpV